ncbi:MAG TPA: type II secretion system protein M [Burkholderiales bacterium]
MKAIYAGLLEYWRGLAPRERTALALGGAVAAILLFYGLVWEPFQRDLARLRETVPQEYQQLQWMRAQLERVQQLRASAGRTVPGGGLLSFVEQSAQAYNIRANVRRMEPQGANGVNLAIDGVPFNNLLEWLANLQKQGGVRIENASLEATGTPGLVNARVLLRAPS